MEEITRKIELYHNLFLGCLVLCILCLVIAVVIFFVLDIKNVLGYLTGRKAKKQIQELEAANASSGRLMPRERSNMQYVAKEMKEDMGVRGTATPGARKVENAVQEGAPPGMTGQTSPKAVQEDTAGAEETSLLQEYSGEQETSLLKDNSGGLEITQTGDNSGGQETFVLSENEQQPVVSSKGEEESRQQVMIDDGSTEALQETKKVVGTFRIEREIIMIHAEEVI